MAREQFFLPIKVIGVFRTRGKRGIGLPSAGHPLNLPHRGYSGWSGMEGREKVPLSPKHPPSCDAVSVESNSSGANNEPPSLQDEMPE